MFFDLERFKKSNVARIFLAYAVVAFASMQVLGYLLPIIEAPLWVAQTLTLLLFLGFPISLLIGWALQRPSSNISDSGPNNQTISNSVTRQKLVVIGLASSALFGFLGLVLMPYMLDQAEYASDGLSSNNAVSQAPLQRGIRTELNLGFTGVHPFWGFRTKVDISPDGTKLAFLNQNDQGGDIMIRDLLSLDPPRTLYSYSNAGGYVGFFDFSTDGEWIVFKDNASLWRIRIEGGAPQNIVQGPHNAGYLLTDEHAYFTEQSTGNLIRADVDGNNDPEVIAEGVGESFFWPQLLPGNSHLLITAATNSTATASTSRTQIIDLNSLERETLIETAFNARYSDSGHILFSRDASVWAVPFDIDRFELIGDQVPVILGVETDQRRGIANYAFSKNGRLLYLAGDSLNLASSNLSLLKFSRDGDLTVPDLEDRQFGHVAMSPNERQVALTLYENASNSDIWIWDLDRDILGRRTFAGNATRPIWSDDGRSIIYSVEDVENSGSGGLWTLAANGSTQPAPLFQSRERLWPHYLTSDGALLFTMHSGPMGAYSVKLPQYEDSTGPEQQATSLDLMPGNPTEFASLDVSPNGHWLSYVSAETGINEVYIRPYPEIETGKWQASVGGGNSPLWSSSGSELFYNRGREQFSVSYSEGEFSSEGVPTYIEFDRPVKIAEVPIVAGVTINDPWAYSSQRDEFIAITSGSIPGAADSLESLLAEQVSLVVIEDWFAELNSLAPPRPD